MEKPNIDDFINYNPDVGPLQLLEVGYPGSGKSNHASSIVTRCLKRENEMAIMHGDITCEWRHYLLYQKYVKGIHLVIPNNVEVDYLFPKHKYNWKTSYFNPEDFDITKYLRDGHMTVIYDDCFDSLSKTILWTEIAKQLILRTKYYNKTITYLCHEAHVPYPQTAQEKQWRALNKFCEYFIFFRKRLIRAVLLTQIETEVYDRVRKKCIYRVYRNAFPSNRTHYRIVKKYVFRMSIDKYHLFFGDLYVPLNSNPKMKELSGFWLMTPREIIELNGETPSSKTKENWNTKKSYEKIIMKKYDELGSYNKVAKDLGISTSTVKWNVENYKKRNTKKSA